MYCQRSAVALVALSFSAPVFAEGVVAVLRSDQTRQALDYQFTPSDERLLDEIQRGCFLYLWKEIGEPACLVKDRQQSQISSVAAVGFQLSSLPIGVERGWITRDEGAQRAETVLRALIERDDNKKFGVYLHFVDHHTAGLKPGSPEVQASTIDHALLMAGALPAGVYFGDRVAQLVDQLVAETDWRAFAVAEGGLISFGWRSEEPNTMSGAGNFRPWKWWIASDEERLVYFLAVGAPDSERGVPPQRYYQLQRTIKQFESLPPHVVSWNGALFTYLFSHCWIDFARYSADNPAQFGIDAPRVDWVENSRRAILTQRARAIAAADNYATLSENRWGLSPCTGLNERGQPAYLVPELRPSLADHDRWCQGTVAPYAAGSAIMVTPAESLAALREFRTLRDADHNLVAWRDPDQAIAQGGGYGLVDSFNLDQQHASDDYVGIDVGPMLLAIENARTGLIWKLFHQHSLAQTSVARLKWQADTTPATGEGVGPARLPVMTFNIRYGTAADGDNAWPQRRELVFDVFRKHRPVVAGLQEALRHQLDELAVALPNYGEIGVGRDDGQEQGEYTAILYDRERIAPLEHGTFWFSDTPTVPGSITWNNACTRICTWAYCLDQETNQKFYFYNVHWDHVSQPSREKSAELLMTRIGQRRDQQAPVLVCGDFNALEQNPAFRRLLTDSAERLRDTYRELHPAATEVGTYHGFRGGAAGRKIDAVLASDEWRVHQVEIVREETNGQYPSDHYPVTATMER